MEKKSLGRGLEDIADIFISQKKKTPPTADSPSKDVKAMTGESYPEHSFEDSERRRSFSENHIITVIDDKIKVTRSSPDTDPSPGHDVSEMDDDRRTGDQENTLEDCPDVCEIKEHVTSKKEIGFLNTPDVQKNIKKTLSQHLRQNYNIKNIELVKVNEVSRPGMKNTIEQRLSIYIKQE